MNYEDLAEERGVLVAWLGEADFHEYGVPRAEVLKDLAKVEHQLAEITRILSRRPSEDPYLRDMEVPF